jgi:hypothetical protein
MEANIMRNLKKTLALLVSVVMILGFFSFSAMATDVAMTGVAITGDRFAGGTLTADVAPGTADPAATFQWYDSANAPSGAVAAQITWLETTTNATALGTGATQAVGSIAVGRRISVVATQTGTPNIQFVATVTVIAEPVAWNGSFNLLTETLFKGNATHWRWAAGTSNPRWTAFGDNASVVPKLGAAGTLQIWTGGGTPAHSGDNAVTATVSIAIGARPARPSAPAIAIAANGVDVTFPVTNAQEVRPLNRSEWEKGTGTYTVAARSANQTWQFRVAAAGAGTLTDLTATSTVAVTPGSVPVNVRVPALARTPAPRINYARSVMGANVNWEISATTTTPLWTGWRDFDSRSVILGVQDPADLSAATAKVKGLAPGTYLVRMKADGSKNRPASAEATVTIVPGAAFNETMVGSGVNFFAITAKGQLVPAQGVLLEHFANDKWNRGLPRAATFGSTQVRLAGSATVPGSVSFWLLREAPSTGNLTGLFGGNTEAIATAKGNALSLLLGDDSGPGDTGCSDPAACTDSDCAGEHCLIAGCDKTSGLCDDCSKCEAASECDGTGCDCTP